MNFEWAHLVIGILSASFGAIGGLVAGVWRVARIEGTMRADFQKAIDAMRADLEERVEDLIPKVEESFKALRQKINDVELNTEKHFLSKDGFNEFRKEYREDMLSLMKKIDHITLRADR